MSDNRIGTSPFPLRVAAGTIKAMRARNAPRKSKIVGAINRAALARPVVERLTVGLPMPPSTNALYANVSGKGRVKTAAYRQWIHDAGWQLQSQRPGRIEGRYHIEIILSFPSNARSIDLDNVKAISDLLVKHGVIEDDSLAESFSVRRGSLGEGARVVIWKDGA